jgi:tripartite-type tricarboxylate transporter receptor subunit TctC
LRALAVAGPKRLEDFPGVPTLAELGVPGVDVVQWYGLFAPAGTPVAAIDRLNRALNEVLADPEVVERFERHGARAEPGRADALAQRMQADLGRWRQVVAQAELAPKESRQLALD